MTSGWRTSFLHPVHRGTCGCAVTETDPREVVVCRCGAGYIRAEVDMFPVWRCYDCGRWWLEPGLPDTPGLRAAMEWFGR